MEAFRKLTATAAPIQIANIDSDQIIPARFLKTPRSTNHGQFLFHDMRRGRDGNLSEDFILNQKEFRASGILVADNNFGCGSSRESAVYALHDAGIKCVIAPSFGDIFYTNSLKNGLLPIKLDRSLCKPFGRRWHQQIVRRSRLTLKAKQFICLMVVHMVSKLTPFENSVF